MGDINADICSILLLIEEFIQDPYNIDEVKVDKLKDYYYRLFVRDKLNVSRDDLLIGINKKCKDRLLFKDTNNMYPILVLNLQTNKYYYQYKNLNTINIDNSVESYYYSNCFSCLLQ